MESMLDIALGWYLAERGLKIFPCEGKKPLTPHGYKDASNEPVKVTEWWTKWPYAQFGVPTGQVNQLLVLDIDGPRGQEWLVKQNFPLTFTVETSPGHLQLWFRQPAGYTTKSTAGSIAPEVDIRGDGGYAIGPFSIHHEAGTIYKPVTAEDAPRLDAPLELLSMASSNGNGELAARDGKIPRGSRHHAMLSLSGSLRARGMREDLILSSIRPLNQQMCAPPLPDDELRKIVQFVGEKPAGDKAGTMPATLESLSTEALFSAHEKTVDWLAWPLFSPGLCTIVDAAPKVGKTRMILGAIHASRVGRHFLSLPTKPVRAIYISEQSGASLAVQMREVGFDGSEPIEELRIVTREHWSRFVFAELLRAIESQFLQAGAVEYNALIFDCWHTIARLEDENNAAEVNQIGNLTIDLAARYGQALVLGRHDRKSGGDVGQSGRSSIHLSGLMDVICHLTRTGNDAHKRKLELVGRVPGLTPEQKIELMPDGSYLNWGSTSDQEQAEETKLEELLTANPKVDYRTIENFTGIGKNRVRDLADSIGWRRDNGKWSKRKPS